MVRLEHVRHQITAALVAERMSVGHRMAPIELLQHRPERVIAEELALIIRHQADAIHFQGVERIFDLPQRAVHIRQRHRREHAEAAGMIGDQLGGKVVGLAGESARGIVVAEKDARLAH
jgi:hypothetical protein